MTGGDNDKTDFPQKLLLLLLLLLLLNDRQVLRLIKVFANNSSANGLLMRVGLPLMRNVITQLAKTFS